MDNQLNGVRAMLLSAALMLTPAIAPASVSFNEYLSNDPYHVGKITYHRKLACSSCPLSKTIIDASMYKSVVESLNTDEQLLAALNDKERTAVTFYLEQLFTPR